LAEGIQPDRDGRPYVLRRVMRRAIRHGHRLGIRDPFLHEVALEVVERLSDVYPELGSRRGFIANMTRLEEERFRETLERGLKILDEEIGALRAAGASQTFQGGVAFKLHDTYGFPIDLTEVIVAERGLSLDRKGYDEALEEQRRQSEGGKLHSDGAIEQVWREVADLVKAGVKFVGYEREEGEGTVVALVKGGHVVPRVVEGDEAVVVTDVTPFYGESGGQVGDQGFIERRGEEPMRFDVDDTQKPIGGVVAHFGKITRGSLGVGETVHLQVDGPRRTATRRNHSATHLLHWALRTVLGEQATQKGSLVGPDRLRFDFAHGKPLSADEITRIEDLVNAKVLTSAPVLTEVLPIDEARKRGAVAMFGEKYGDVVRVLTMTKDSVELCGGTHARSLGEIGLFKLVTEQGLAAGVRRIEAATGLNALAYVRSIEGTLRGAARLVKSSPADLPDKIEKVMDRERQLERELADMKRKLAMGGGSAAGGLDEMLRGARDVPGGKALAVRAPVGDAATLREVAEKLRDKLGDSVVLVGAPGEDKAMLVLTVSKSLTGRYKAGDLIKGIAQAVGGSGGGRPDMAQAGGPDVAKLDEALESLYSRLA
jgi:alanyl-tRNA synthetase